MLGASLSAGVLPAPWEGSTCVVGAPISRTLYQSDLLSLTFSSREGSVSPDFPAIIEGRGTLPLFSEDSSSPGFSAIIVGRRAGALSSRAAGLLLPLKPSAPQLATCFSHLFLSTSDCSPMARSLFGTRGASSSF
jgi:hypothetical protein